MGYFLVPDAILFDFAHFSEINSCVTDGPTDGRTDRRTDTPSYRDARTHLKTDLISSLIVVSKKSDCEQHISALSRFLYFLNFLGGTLAVNDLTAYLSQIRQPFVQQLAGFTFLTPPPPSLGFIIPTSELSYH